MFAKLEPGGIISIQGTKAPSTAIAAMYGLILLLAAIAYFVLQRTIIADQGENSVLAKAVGSDVKGKLSPVLYAIAIPAAFVHQWISGGLYVLVALIWLIPDRRKTKLKT